MNKQISAVQTDGSNGYSPGTWEGRVTVTLDDGRELLSFSGGFASRESALKWANECAKNY